MRTKDIRMAQHRANTRPTARDRGAAMVEMAILTPLLFLLTLGAFELGRGVWTKHTLSHVAREAARYASVRSVTSDDPATAGKIEARAKSAATGVDTSKMNVTTTWNPSNQQGGTVRVQVSYNFKPVTALIPFKSLTLTSNSQRVIAY
jgi:Flp pilus assembly protein TadG